MRNKKFAEINEEFRKDCSTAGIEPTHRQASKYNMGQGLAYQVKIKRLRKEIFQLHQVHSQKRKDTRASA